VDAPKVNPSFDPRTIERPHESLLTYYGLCSLFGLVLAPIIFIPMFCKYITLRYRFDDDGVSMSYGVLFRHETNLTYRRIQDIHLSRNIVQRWMGLATISIQTASGSGMPEMQIEGVLEYETLRDFLYTKMRGARGLDHDGVVAVKTAEPGGAPEDEALVLLRQIAADMSAIRAARERGAA
jgi:membrane protein YdbS with pleckstrin-like domain